MEVIAAHNLALLGLLGYGTYKAMNWPNHRKNPTHIVKGLRGYNIKKYKPKPGENKLPVTYNNKSKVYHHTYLQKKFVWWDNPNYDKNRPQGPGNKPGGWKKKLIKVRNFSSKQNVYKAYFRKFKPYKLI